MWSRDVAEATAAIAAVALLANLGLALAGWMIWTRGEAMLVWAGRYAMGMIALGLLATYGVHASAPAAFLVVTGASAAVLLVGAPSKTRAMVGFVLVGIATSLAAAGAVRQLGALNG